MYQFRGGPSILSEGLSVWLVVLAVCGVIFIYIVSGRGDSLKRAVRCGCYDRERIRQGQWWRLLTVGFTHIQPWHIAMNLMALYNLRVLEDYFGHAWYALILLASVAGGSLLEYATSRVRYSVGLSGGLYGLMFSYFLILLTYRSVSGLRGIALTLILNLIINFMPGVAWQAHIGGAITGMLLTGLFLVLH
jgi:membrane associated rhomboid family serine protease